MAAVIIGVLALAFVGNAMATPQQRLEADRRWDKPGKIIFLLAAIVVVYWIWRG